MTLSYDEILEYEAAFRAVDVDNDGAIDVKELGKLFICFVSMVSGNLGAPSALIAKTIVIPDIVIK